MSLFGSNEDFPLSAYNLLCRSQELGRLHLVRHFAVLEVVEYMSLSLDHFHLHENKIERSAVQNRLLLICEVHCI
jgi:hypothetical protein